MARRKQDANSSQLTSDNQLSISYLGRVASIVVLMTFAQWFDKHYEAAHPWRSVLIGGLCMLGCIVVWFGWRKAAPKSSAYNRRGINDIRG